MKNTKGIEIIQLKNVERKLAWLAMNLMEEKGKGIIYCFSFVECEYIKEFLAMAGIQAEILRKGSFGNVSRELEREEDVIKNAFLNGEIDVLLVSFKYTVDLLAVKEYIDFVYFFERPITVENIEIRLMECFGNRRGRCVILLEEKEEISDNYFFRKCENRETVNLILEYFQKGGGAASETQMQICVNRSFNEIRHSLRYLLDKGILKLNKEKYYYWNHPNSDLLKDIEAGEKELKEQRDKMICFFNEIGIEIFRETEEFQQAVEIAEQFFAEKVYPIKPKKMWPAGFKMNNQGKIKFLCKEGIAIAQHKRCGYGWLIDRDFSSNNISDELVEIVSKKLAFLIEEKDIGWITYMEESESEQSMRKFAEKLGNRLGLYVSKAFSVNGSLAEYQNPVQECRGMIGHCKLNVSQCYKDNVLLLKKSAGSGYVLAYGGYSLKAAGCGEVYPCALLLEDEIGLNL